MSEITWGTSQGHPHYLFLILKECKKMMNSLKLNLGCGIKTFDGPWINLDINPSVKPDIVADAHHLPFIPNAFDFTLASEILEHVKKPIQVLKEIRKVSKCLKLSVPDGLLKCLMRLLVVQYPFIKEHRRYYTRSLLKKHLSTAGWHIRKIWKGGSISVMGKRFKFGNHFIAICV